MRSKKDEKRIKLDSLLDWYARFKPDLRRVSIDWSRAEIVKIGAHSTGGGSNVFRYRGFELVVVE